MQHHKLDFRNKNHTEQIAMFGKLLNALDALPVGQRDHEFLEELRGVDAAARASHAKVISLCADLKSEISNRKALLKAGRTAANHAGTGALLKTRGQPEDVLAVGLALAAPNTVPVGVPAAPTNLRAGPTASEGEAMLRWRRTVRRCSFEVQWHADPPDADLWHHEDTCFQQKYLVKGRVSGAKYWFRVRASNAHGESGWSNLASVRVK